MNKERMKKMSNWKNVIGHDFTADDFAQIEREGKSLAMRECNCMKVAQDDTCPVGYPSMLCKDCKGKGVMSSD